MHLNSFLIIISVNHIDPWAKMSPFAVTLPIIAPPSNTILTN